MCRISIDLEEESYPITDKMIKAVNSKIKCGECGATIEKGEKFELTILKGDFRNQVSYFHSFTCRACVQIRSLFFEGGWYYNQIWEDISDCRDEITLDQIDKLSEPARNKLIEMLDL